MLFLMAADLAAAAGRPVRANLDVADLAGDVACAAVDPVVQHQATADPGADEDAEHVAATAPGAAAVLGDHGRAHVVLEPDRQAELGLQRRPDRLVVPIEVRRQLDDPGLGLERTRDGHAEAADLAQLDAGRLAGLVGGLDDPGQNGGRALACLGQQLGAGLDAVFPIDDRGEYLGPAEVDPDDDRLVAHMKKIPRG